MFVRLISRAVLVGGAAVVLAGCMPKMTIEEMKSMLPERPVELDKLNAFAGKWVFEGEAEMAGLDEPLKSSGHNEAHWDGDNWFLVSRGTFKMGDLGEMEGVETWTYDTHDKVYRSTWVDTFGSVGTGTSKYDDKTDTWKFRATSHGPFGKSKMKGKVQFVNADTMEWSMSEYSMCGLMKTMEMNGTSRRE